MKKKLSYKNILLALLFLLGFVSCQKADDNGDLGGFWKLMEVDYVATGESKNLKENSYFMAVQLDLISFRGAGSYYARFSHEGDSLFMWMIGDDVKSSFLDKFGMNSTEQRFYVETLSSKKMVLRSNYSKLRFKKF